MVKIYIGVNPVTTAHMCCDETGSVYDWTYAVKVTEPEIVPWTFYTAPKKLGFMLRFKGDRSYVSAASAKSKIGMTTGTAILRYALLVTDYEWSEDGENWMPCGIEEKG